MRYGALMASVSGKTKWPVITVFLRFPGIDLHRDLKDAQLWLPGVTGSQSTFMGFMSSISPRSTPEV